MVTWEGDKARLLSGTIRADTKTGGKCLDFWFHMYGPDIGDLTISQHFGGANQTLWRRTGDNGDRWRHGSVSMTGGTDYQVLITTFCDYLGPNRVAE